jgi:hypothetical protein
MRWLGLVVAGVLAGCTVVVPSVTTYTVVNPTPAPATSPTPEEPWPSRGPQARPSVSTRFDKTFSGNGARERIGPVSLQNRSFTITARFETLVIGSGSFELELQTTDGKFVQSLFSEHGSFERAITRDVEIRDDYYLALSRADGLWELRVEVE